MAVNVYSNALVIFEEAKATHYVEISGGNLGIAEGALAARRGESNPK